MKLALRSWLLAIFAILFAGNVKADTVVMYTLTVGSTTIATFSVPQFPATDPSTAPTYFGISGMGIILTPLNLVINGASSPDTVEFFNSAIGGGLEDIPTDPTATPAFNFVGDQFYTGNEAGNDPTAPLQMLGGTSTVFACEDLACKSVGDAPETITPSVVSTPEPSALLLFGVGLAGLVLLRKRYAVNHSV